MPDKAGWHWQKIKNNCFQDFPSFGFKSIQNIDVLSKQKIADQRMLISELGVAGMSSIRISGVTRSQVSLSQLSNKGWLQGGSLEGRQLDDFYKMSI